MLLFRNSPENFFTKFRVQKRQVWELSHSVSPEAKTLRFAGRLHTQETEVPRKSWNRQDICYKIDSTQKIRKCLFLFSLVVTEPHRPSGL